MDMDQPNSGESSVAPDKVLEVQAKKERRCYCGRPIRGRPGIYCREHD
jgi:hypothetical protein